jgi:LysR family transcriptional repressor of citA
MGENMDTRNLKTFLVLAQVKNFTRTAEKLYVAQSTVTNRIAELEREIGKKLFTRDQPHIKLTKEGELFVPFAQRILDLEELSLERLNTAHKYEEIIRIGTTNTIYESYLAEKFRSKRKVENRIAVKILLGHSVELLQQLQDGILDMAYSYIPLYKRGFSCEVFQKEKLVLVTGYHNDQYTNGIRKEDLLKVDYLMCNFKLQGVGEFLSELFPVYHQFSFEIDNSTKMIPYLLEGSGYSFLPENMVNPYIIQKKLRVIPVSDFQTPEIISYCIRVKKQITSAVLQE